jgi:hypothetical protein
MELKTWKGGKVDELLIGRERAQSSYILHLEPVMPGCDKMTYLKNKDATERMGP